MHVLGNELPQEKRVAHRADVIEVDRGPGFRDPTKLRAIKDAERVGAARDRRRAGCSSPTATAAAVSLPPRCLSGSSSIEPVEWLLEHESGRHLRRRRRHSGHVHGRARAAGRRLVSFEAVIAKDLASALLAKDLAAEALAIVTGVDAVYADWGTSEQRSISVVRLATRPRHHRVRRGLDGIEGARRHDRSSRRLRRPQGDRLVLGHAGTAPSSMSGTSRHARGSGHRARRDGSWSRQACLMTASSESPVASKRSRGRRRCSTRCCRSAC